jgi:GH24 family phage-related lysozyme (muramidase)
MIPQAAINLILDDEGVEQPWKWPGDDSGITIGHGHDLGFEAPSRFVQDWTPQIGAKSVAELTVAIGKSGSAAARLAPQFRDINITKAQADAVFFASTLPEYEAQTEEAFPGVDALPDAACGALVSLVFNRGTSLAGPRRREMQSIHDANRRLHQPQRRIGYHARNHLRATPIDEAPVARHGPRRPDHPP